jgi:hypothetical protein
MLLLLLLLPLPAYYCCSLWHELQVSCCPACERHIRDTPPGVGGGVSKPTHPPQEPLLLLLQAYC